MVQISILEVKELCGRIIGIQGRRKSRIFEYFRSGRRFANESVGSFIAHTYWIYIFLFKNVVSFLIFLLFFNSYLFIFITIKSIKIVIHFY